jgi:hypothetical protein
MIGRRSIAFELAVFLMDHHSGQYSRGYRLLSRLSPRNFSASFCAEMRETEVYSQLVTKFGRSV